MRPLEALQGRLRSGVALAVGVGTVAAGGRRAAPGVPGGHAALPGVGVAAASRPSRDWRPSTLALHADDTARRLVDPRLRTFLDGTATAAAG